MPICKAKKLQVDSNGVETMGNPMPTTRSQGGWRHWCFSVSHAIGNSPYVKNQERVGNHFWNCSNLTSRACYIFFRFIAWKQERVGHCSRKCNIALKCSHVHCLEARACWKLLQEVQQRTIMRVLKCSSVHSKRVLEINIQRATRRHHELVKMFSCSWPRSKSVLEVTLGTATTYITSRAYLSVLLLIA